MPSRLSFRRPISVGNSSGAINDGLDQIYRLASEGSVDAITADYLAEFNIAWRAIEMLNHPDLGYERGFLDQLDYRNAAELIMQKGIKVVHDGGALNPEGLARETDKLLHQKGITSLKVAWVTGDNIMPDLDSLIQTRGAKFEHLDIPGSQLSYEKSKIVSANAYIGMQGIIVALKEGADIVICGRCCDASPVMALAAWWHNWREDQYDELAGSLIAGHLIECGPYVTGGNFSGFKQIPKLYRVGFPIAEIASDGVCTITKHKGTNGAVTIDTVKAQLIYEIQGPYYLNPDVIAKIDQVEVIEIGPDQVEVRGLVGLPPPLTNKVAFFHHGGYQAEICAFAVGIDIPAKVALQREQVLKELDPSEFTTISIEAYGAASENPRTQREATVAIRHFVQAPTKLAIEKFKKALFMSGLQGYPGLHFHMDWRTLDPKPYATYYPATLDQKALRVETHLPGLAAIAVRPPKILKKFEGQESYDPKISTDLAIFGETERRPLGDLCYARSGDKGGNANVGIWVQDECHWAWLQSFLTIARFKDLLGDDYNGFVIERFELPHIFAVHFLTYGILQQGVSSSSIIDGLAKSFGEFLRARVVDIPSRFLR